MTGKRETMAALKWSLSALRSIGRIVRNGQLRLRGINVAWTANVHSSAEINCKRGTVSIGACSSIDKGAILRTYGGHIRIGSNSSINPYCVIYGHGGLTIGNGVRIAAHTVIIPANHNYLDSSIFVSAQGETKQGITVEDDVWLGAGVRVLDGVTIAKGCVVGAGSVLTKSTVSYGVYVGVPARKIAARSSSATMNTILGQKI